MKAVKLKLNKKKFAFKKEEMYFFLKYSAEAKRADVKPFLICLR